MRLLTIILLEFALRVSSVSIAFDISVFAIALDLPGT
jgi:hypothetical protein